MRRAAKADDNQPEIVAALRKAGATVTPTHTAGDGFPDLVVGCRCKKTGEKRTYLIEVKDGNKPPSKQKLTPAQVKWHAEWRGQVSIVTNVTEALAVLGIELRGETS